MHEELNDVHLLSCELVSDGGAGGVAVWPGAAVNQMHRAAFGRRLVVPVVVEAAVPAVQRSGQRGAFNLHVNPVTATQHKRALSAHEQRASNTNRPLLLILRYTGHTHFLVMTSCDRHAGANMALKLGINNQSESMKKIILKLTSVYAEIGPYGTSLSVFLSSMPKFWM